MIFPTTTTPCTISSKVGKGRKRVAEESDELNINILGEICYRLSRNDPTLTILNLNHAGIGNRGAILLSEALRNSSHIVVLFLDNNDISSKGFQLLAKTIANHVSLKMVYLSHNFIGTAGVSFLANEFNQSKRRTHHQQNHRSSRLEVLKLSYNSIGSSGVSELIKSIPVSLHTLTLDGNCICNQGMTVLAEALRTNTSLRRLDLRYNLISSQIQCIQSFVNVLRDDNRILSELILEQNEWDAPPKTSATTTTGTTDIAPAADDDDNIRKMTDELCLYLRLNRIGRHSFGATTIPKSLWPRVLGKTTGSNNGSIRISTSSCCPYHHCTTHGCCCCCCIVRHRPNVNEIGFRPDTAAVKTSTTAAATTTSIRSGDPNATYTLLTTRPDLLLCG